MASLGVAAVAIAVLAVLNRVVYAARAFIFWLAWCCGQRVEIRCPCNAGWRHCRLLYSVKEKHGRSPAKRLEHVLHPWGRI